LKLSGGIRFDIVNATGVRISSFIEFPNGKVREVVMYGEGKQDPAIVVTNGVEMEENLVSDGGGCSNHTSAGSSTIDLYPAVNTNGPIYMRISELLPDTILFHELERSTDKIILTGSLSVVQLGGDGGEQGDHSSCAGGGGVHIMELVQVSHELDGGGTDGNIIKGHQVWRYKIDSIEKEI
jgi:hypothetical protein